LEVRHAPLWAEFRRLDEAETVDFATITAHALWVDYVMAVPTRDRCVAMAEAVQVWAEYREVAERRGLRKVYLSPSLFPPRVIVSALAERSFGLTVPITRGDDGQWKWHGRGPCMVEADRSYVQELPFGTDDSIAGIQLQDPSSAREVMVNPEPETTEDNGFTRYRYTNGGGNEVITFSQHPGAEKYSIAVVRVTKPAENGLVPVFPGRPIQFISGRGIRIGLTENEVRSILGEPTAESEGTLIYQLEVDNNPAWLKKHNMPVYRGTYRFEGGELVTFEFGFPYS
jgi:hypothetical protein